MTDDGGCSLAGAVQTAGAGRGQTLDEFDFPAGRISSGPPVRYMARGLNKPGGTHVVAAVYIGGQLVEQIPLVGNALGAKVPEVMMRIADG